jgi:hypothetical protein
MDALVIPKNSVVFCFKFAYVYLKSKVVPKKKFDPTDFY